MNLKKICYKGEHNDNYHANALALKCMFVSFGVLLLCWILDILNIFIVELTIMHIATASAALICLAAVVYSFTVGIDTKASCYIIMFLMVAMATVLAMQLAYHTTLFLIFPLVCSSQYFDKKISNFTAVATCIGVAVSVMVGYDIGLCDANMLLLTKTYSAVHVQELLSGTFEINTNRGLMFLFFVFPRWLIILAMMPLLNHVAKDIQIRTAREAMARHMAEIDGLTGIYNRTKYLQDISGYYLNCDRIAVMFFDVNNLKLVNDTRGHEYGDILIKGLSEVLKSRQSEFCRCYRIGGDEFVMILEKAEAQQANYIYKDLEKSLQGKLLEEDICLSVAIGMTEGSGKNVESLVKSADEQMYKNKQLIKSKAQ